MATTPETPAPTPFLHAMRPDRHNLDSIAVAQREWVAAPIAARLSVLSRLRASVASSARELAETIPTSLPGALHRNVADSLIAEVLPLLEACRFLEREAGTILRRRSLDSERFRRHTNSPESVNLFLHRRSGCGSAFGQRIRCILLK